eukprot:COSAG05_NODE_10078_length_584_cov_0.806186_1_plen_153_part_01
MRFNSEGTINITALRFFGKAHRHLRKLVRRPPSGYTRESLAYPMLLLSCSCRLPARSMLCVTTRPRAAQEEGTPEDMLKELWATFDDDGSGQLDRTEVADVIAAALERKPKPEELEKAFAEMDADGSGEIDYPEFASWWNSQSGTTRARAQRK